MITVEELTESAREYFEERAGILEFENGLPQEVAERLAMEGALLLMDAEKKDGIDQKDLLPL